MEDLRLYYFSKQCNRAVEIDTCVYRSQLTGSLLIVLGKEQKKGFGGQREQKNILLEKEVLISGNPTAGHKLSTTPHLPLVRLKY